MRIYFRRRGGKRCLLSPVINRFNLARLGHMQGANSLTGGLRISSLGA